MQYGPKTITDGLVFFTDGTQGYAGDDAIKTPEDIPNCCLWLDASDTSSFSLSGSNVTQWNDKSGNGNHATAYNSSNYPQYSSSYTVNGKNAINFIATSDTAGQMLKGSFTTSGANQPGQNGGYTRFVVYKQHNFVSTESDVIFEMAQGSYLSGSYGSRNVINAEGSGYSQDRLRFYNQGTSIYANLRAENNIVLMSEVLNSSTGYLQAFVNGYRWGNSSTTNYTFTDYVIGNDMTDGDFFNGYICEIIIFNRALSDQERLQIDFYLARKWDLAFYSLATDQTYQRRLKDMGGDSSVSNSASSWIYYNPGLMPGRGVLYQKDNGRKINFAGSSAVQNLAGTGTSGELTIEWACACMSHLDNGTNYEIFSNESYQNNGIVIRHGGNNWRPYVRFSHGGSPTYSNLYVDAADAPYSGEWAHWMVWFSGSECKWYKNGTQVQNNTSFSAPATSSLTTAAPFGGGGSQTFNGEVAFVKMYNRALTTTEIAQSYQYAQNRIDQIPKIPKPRDVQRFYDVDMFGRNANTTYWYDLSYNNSYSNAATTGASVVGPTLTSTTYLYPKYYSLDGTDDRFDITSYTFGNGNWCVSTWVNADSFNDVTIMSNSSSSPVANAFGFDYGPNATWNIAYWNYGYANNGAGPGGSWYNNFGNSSLSTKKWYMLTWVNYSDKTMKMYVNGVADSSTFYSETTNGGPCDRIGMYNTPRYFDGKIANFMIWDVALTDAEVLQNFNFYKNRFGY